MPKVVAMEIHVKREGDYFEGFCCMDGYLNELEGYLPLVWSVAFQRQVLESFPEAVLQVGEEADWQDLSVDPPYLNMQINSGYFLCNAGYPPGYLYEGRPAAMDAEEFENAVSYGAFCAYIQPRVDATDALQFLLDTDEAFSVRDNWRKDMTPEWIPEALKVYTYVLTWQELAEFPLLFTLGEEENRAFFEEMIALVAPPVSSG